MKKANGNTDQELNMPQSGPQLTSEALLGASIPVTDPTLPQEVEGVKGQELPTGKASFDTPVNPALTQDQRTKLMSRMFSGATDKQLGLAIQKLSPEATQAVIAEGLQPGSGTDSFYQAKRLQQKLASGEAITPSELGRLYRANEDTRIGPNSRHARQEIAAREQGVASGLDGTGLISYNGQEEMEISGVTPEVGVNYDGGAIREDQGVDSGAQAQEGDRSGVPEAVRGDKEGIRSSGLALRGVQRLKPAIDAAEGYHTPLEVVSPESWPEEHKNIVLRE